MTTNLSPLRRTLIGESLGPYKILEPLGAGGMGEVYLGEDTRLGRKVAIKVLPEEYASDPERLARFEQEARAAAALNHPHIAVVHDVGSEAAEDGTTTHFMVQEYLEGQSLRERLDKGALPLHKALDLSVEVGEALIAAHKAGIIHRDLKPDNIFVTEEGHAKVLDFGLAKLTEVAAPTGTSASMSPTMLGTVAGQVMGTAGYMAPEQVNGEEVDHRADLFAFGTVLYETVTGQRAFVGENVHDTLNQILSGEPLSIEQIDDSFPFELQRIVTKCLAKERARRYQGSADLVVDLRALPAIVEASEIASADGRQKVAVDPSATSRGIPLGLGVLAGFALVVTTMLIVTFALQPSPIPVSQVNLAALVPEGLNFNNPGRRVLAISPDGEQLAFVAGGQLWVRSLNEPIPKSLHDNDAPHTPFFSADGNHLGFVAGAYLWTVAITGGPAKRVASVPVVFGASWSDEETIYFGGGATGIWSVPASGGDPERVVVVDDGEIAYGPQLLPGGEWVLFTVRSAIETWDDATIFAENLVTQKRKPLVSGGTEALYVSTGQLLFARGDSLFAGVLDLELLELAEPPTPVFRDVAMTRNNATGAAQYVTAESGTLAYVPSSRGELLPRQVFSVAPDGTDVRPLLGQPIDAASLPVLSPDGERLALVSHGELWVYFLDGRPEIRLTSMGVTQVVWTPDGSGLVVESGGGLMFHVAAEASGQQPRQIGGLEGHKHPTSWTSDGRLVYTAIGLDGSDSILSMSLDDSTEPQGLLVREANDRQGVVSPDGRWIAFRSDDTGELEIWIMELDGPRLERVSSAGGDFPSWSGSGHELYYSTPDTMMVVAFDEGEPRLPAQPLFPRRQYLLGNQWPYYDVAEDGRFVMIEADAPGESPRLVINVILNWVESLKDVIPAGR